MSTDAKKWLESVSTRESSETQHTNDVLNASWRSILFGPVFLCGLGVSSVSRGSALCSLRVPPHLTDEEGNWQLGSIATLIDLVAAATIMSSEGPIKVSVNLDISFFSQAKLDDEVVIKAHTLQNKGRLTTVMVEVRKKDTGQLLAVGREWMTATSARPFESKL